MPREGATGNSGKDLSAARARFRDAWFAGDAPDIDAFCRQHPECGPELREKLEDFLYVMGHLPMAGDEDLESVSGGTEEKDDEDDETPGDESLDITIDDFRLIREIGRGGMGVVYEAEQVSLKRRVALKVLPRHFSLSDERIRKFRREAEAGGRQHHPGIVSVFAVGEFEGVHYIAQELIARGRTLADRIAAMKRRSRIPRGYFRHVAKLVIRVAEALQHAHDSGVVHRDVKPSNILIDRSGTPKVTDFGIAKVEGALALSRTGDFFGTPYYMSPEQAASQRDGIDHRTDIFSLGVTLYELLTLALPFEGDTTPEVLKKLLTQDPVDPHKANPRVPRDLSVICCKAIEKEPGDRYPTMEALAEDLRRFTAGDAIEARPAGAVTRLVKRARRNPVLTAAAGVVLAVVIVAIVMVQLLQREADEANAQKEKSDQKAQAWLLTAASAETRESNPGAALKLSLEADEIDSAYETRNAMIEALDVCRERKAVFTGAKTACALLPSTEAGALRVAAGYRDGTFRIWDCASTRPLTGPINAFDTSRPLTAIAFDKKRNRLAVGSFDGRVAIWDLSDLSDVCRIIELSKDWQSDGPRETAHADAITSIAFDRSFEKIVTTSRDLTVRAWDARTGEIITVIMGFMWQVNDAAFSPDGKRLVTASEDGMARIWRLENTREPERVLPHASPVRCAAFGPDGERVLTAAGKAAIVWDARTGEFLPELDGHAALVNEAAFDQGGSLVITASEDRTAMVWNVETGAKIMTLKGHDNGVLHACFCEGGGRREDALSSDPSCRDATPLYRCGPEKTAMTASSDGTVRLWDATPEDRPLGWTRPALSPGGRKKVMISADGCSVQVWDMRTGLSLGSHCPNDWIENERQRGDTPRSIRDVRFSPDGEKLFVNLRDNFWGIWDLELGKKSSATQPKGDFLYYDFTPDSRSLVFTTTRGEVVFVDTGTPEKFDHQETGALIDWFSFDSSGQRAVVLLSNGEVQIRDSRLKEVRLSLDCGGETVRSVAIDRSGKRLATLSDYGTLTLWNGITGVKRNPLECTDCIQRAMFSLSGTSLLTLSQYGKIRLWNVEDITQRRMISDYNGTVQEAGFSPDEKYVWLATDHERIYLWDIKNARRHFRIRLGFMPWSIGFDADSKVLWTGSADDGLLKSHPLDPLSCARDRVPGPLTPEERLLFEVPPAPAPGNDAQVPVISGAGPQGNAVRREGGEASETTNPGAESENPIVEHDEENWLLDTCWEIVRSARAPVREYRFALGLAREAVQRGRAGSEMRGAAEYRMGAYTDAMRTLSNFRKRRRHDGLERDPVEAVFSALTRIEMGNVARAEEDLAFVESWIDADPKAGKAGALRDLIREAKQQVEVEANEAGKTRSTEGSRDHTQLSPEPRGRAFTPIRLLFMARSIKKDAFTELWLFDPQAEDPYQRLFEYEEEDPSAWSISPGGEKLCYVCKKERGLSIKTQTVRGPAGNLCPGEPRELFLLDWENVYACTWSRDAEKIYISGTETYNGAECICWIHANRVEGQQPNFLLDCRGHTFIETGFSKNGEKVCFLHYPGTSRSFDKEVWIARVTRDGRAVCNPVQVTANPYVEMCPCFSPDEKALFYISQFSPRGPFRIHRQSLETGIIDVLFRTDDLENREDLAIHRIVPSPGGALAFNVGSRWGVGVTVTKILDATGKELHTLSDPRWKSCMPLCFLPKTK